MKNLAEKTVIAASWTSVLLLAAAVLYIVGYLLYRGGAGLNISLIFGSCLPREVLLEGRPVFDGIYPAIAGTLLLVIAALLFALPIGVAAGIYMAEYAGAATKAGLGLLFDVLASLPSIVIGLAGFSLTIILHRIFPNELGPCLLISALSLGFLILPYLIRTTQLALESAPLELRNTALALGATKNQNIFKVLLPNRLGDILGGVVLAIGRAAEDTAVIMLTGVVASAGLPSSVFDQFEALPFYIYYISSQYTDAKELQMGFGAAIILLMLCSLLFVVAFIAQRTISWKLRR